MANFNNRRTKIRLQCERAEKEDLSRERLAGEGFTNHEIENYLQNKRMESFRRPLTVHPMDEGRHVVHNVAHTSIGLPGTHLTKSATKDMFIRAQKKLDKNLLQKKTAKENELAQTQKSQSKTKTGEECLKENTVVVERPNTAELERKARKTKSKQIEKLQDHVIKTQNYRDNIREMGKGMSELNKMPKTSHYLEQFVFDNHMQELCDATNFEHHQMQNDLKWYNEAYVKYKSTMRK
jgi:hypothetical protein